MPQEVAAGADPTPRRVLVRAPTRTHEQGVAASRLSPLSLTLGPAPSLYRLGEPQKRPEMKDIIPRLREVRNGPQTARISPHTARSLAHPARTLAHPAHTALAAPPAQVLAGLEVESGAKAGRRSSQPGMSTSPP